VQRGGAGAARSSSGGRTVRQQAAESGGAGEARKPAVVNLQWRRWQVHGPRQNAAVNARERRSIRWQNGSRCGVKAGGRYPAPRGRIVKILQSRQIPWQKRQVAVQWWWQAENRQARGVRVAPEAVQRAAGGARVTRFQAGSAAAQVVCRQAGNPRRW